MKNMTINLLLLLMLGAISSCKDKVSPAVASVNENYTSDLGKAKKWIVGSWKLVAVSVMVPNPAVPNVQLVVNNNQITVIEDGKQIDNVSYEIEKTASSMQLKTNAEPRTDNWYVRNPVLQISENKMYLDLGRAADLPAFDFERVK